MDASLCTKQKQGHTIVWNLPHLPQSTTKDREYSETASIVTLNTPTGGYLTNEETDYDDDTSSSEVSDTYQKHDYDDDSSSSSSDWEPSASMASTYLPRDQKKANNKSHLKPYISIRMDDEDCVSKLNHINTINHILFYPHSNLQSLLFSTSHCYIQTDYKRIKNVNILDEEDTNPLHTTKMDWTDPKSVQKLKDLLHNLFVSASLTAGIREEEIYLMFSTPSPQQIIQELRFGVLAELCDVHIDRFGRRSFYRKDIDYLHRKNKHSINNHTYFYTHTHIPSKLFASHDIHHLSNFVGDSPKYQSPKHLSPRHLSSPHHHHSPKHLSPKHLSPRGKKHVQRMSEDKLEWKNIDYKPVTYLLTKTKATTYNMNSNRTATHIASRHHKKKTNHKIKAPLTAVQETKKDGVRRVKKVNITGIDSKTKSMSVEQFESMDLTDIFVDGFKTEELNDNFSIAKKIAQYFDARFDDTDTVCLVCDNNKQPAISYWIKGQYERKDENVLNNKYILVYRSCAHVAATLPIVSATKFEEYVKDISFQYENEGVQFIGSKLDERFGDGCHYVRSTQRKHDASDYGVYCRYS
eukprot:89522_1